MKTKMWEEVANKITISRVAGAGLGVFAKRSIKQGENLFEERPLILIEAIVKHQDIPWSEKCGYLRRKVQSLSSNERKQYYDLHDCKKDGGNIYRQGFYILVPDEGPRSQLPKKNRK